MNFCIVGVLAQTRVGFTAPSASRRALPGRPALPEPGNGRAPLNGNAPRRICACSVPAYSRTSRGARERELRGRGAEELCQAGRDPGSPAGSPEWEQPESSYPGAWRVTSGTHTTTRRAHSRSPLIFPSLRCHRNWPALTNGVEMEAMSPKEAERCHWGRREGAGGRGWGEWGAGASPPSTPGQV